MPGSPVFWSKDGKTLYGLRPENDQALLFSMDAATGAEKVIGAVGDSMPAAWNNPGIRLSLAPDRKSIAYAISKPRSDLWLLEGFDPPPGRLARWLTVR